MPHPHISNEEIDVRGYQLYEQHIRNEVETKDNIGKIVVIDVETGAYEVDSDARAATKRAFARHPEAALLAVRIGYDAVEGFGGGPKDEAVITGTVSGRRGACLADASNIILDVYEITLL